MNITSFCIRRPVTTGMIFLVITLLGVISASRMPIDLYPEITYPVINISTSYSGAGPEEIEQLITIPIERMVSTINNVRSITSVSSEGFSRVSVYFDWGANLETALDAIRASIDRVKRRLPEDAETPSIFQYDPSATPIMTIGLSGYMDQALLKELAEEEIAYYLQRADGVAAVDIRGGQSREVLVALHRDRLAGLGVTVTQVASAISSENTVQPAGVLETGTAELTLRTHGEIEEVEEIKNIIVTTRNGVPVYLRDVATVEERPRGSESLVRIDGVPGIVLSVQKQSGSNTVAVANRIYKILNELRQRYPDLNIRVLNDTSIFIRNSVASVSDAAILGAFLAGIVLLFFLYNFRATLIAAVVMPISILATLILAYWGKMTLNSVSLGGLALGVGMLVDNTVVVIDNISRKLENPDLLPAGAALEGTVEMGPAITASTLTTVCVFFPLIYLTGQTGIIFSQLSYMVIFSLLCSLLVAMTLTPMLSAKYFHTISSDTIKRNRFAAFSFRIQERWNNSYQRFLGKCLQRKGLVIALCTLVFAASLLLVPLIGTELIPVTDEGVINIRFTLPAGVKLEETDMVARQFEEIITALPELANYEITVGSGWGSSNQGSITVRLRDASERRRTTMDVVRDLQQKLVYPGARIRISARNSMRMLYGGASNAVAIDIRGYNQDLARDTAKLIMDRLSRVPGVSNIDLSREDETPEFAIKINRQRAGDLGITAAQIGMAINYALTGRTATTLRRGGEELPVRVTLREEDISSVEDLKQILVSGRNNRLFPLSSLVEIELTNRPVSIERKDRERNITVTADLDRQDLSAAMRDIQAAMAGLNLPRGITIHYTGDFEEQQRSFNELKWALILALVLVYMVMAAQFESLLDPFIIMFSVPFALTGVLLALFLTDTLFNNQVYIGLIVLGGVVVNNAIVLISYFRLLLERGMSLQEAVVTGSASRLRPILMTTITTILGLVPLALESGSGANLQAPMARAVIGGLTFASIITLVLIPVLFVWVENLRQGFAARRRKDRNGKNGVDRWALPKTGALLLLLLAFIICAQAPARAEAEAATPLEKAPAEAEAAATAKSTPSEMEAIPLEITLSEALALAWENSEDGKIIAAKEESVYSSYRQTTGEKALQVYTEANVTGLAKPDPAGTVELIMEKTLPVANIFGAKSYSDLLAECNLEINLLALETQKTALISRVITAYQALLSAGRDLELAEENYRRAVRFNEEIKVKAKVGLTSIIDETGGEVQVANAQTGLDRAINRYHLAKFDLCRLLGLDEAVELILSPLENAGLEEDLEKLLAAARENRPELRQAGLELARAKTLHELAKLSQNLGIGLTWSFQDDNYRAGVSLSNQTRDGSTGEWNLRGNAGVFLYHQNQSGPAGNNRLDLMLRWTLADGKVRREQVNQASLLLSQREEEEKKTLKNIEYEVKEAYYNYKDLENRIGSSALQLEYNRVYLDATEAKFRSGLASAKEVLEAQLLLNEAEVQYEQVKSNLYLAYVKLLAATGRLSLEHFSLETQESPETQ